MRTMEYYIFQAVSARCEGLASQESKTNHII